MADDRSRLVENGLGGGDEKEEGRLPPPHLIVKVKEETIPEDKKKVCEHCNKEFNGGKALGGHKRIHNPTPKPPKGHPHHPPEQQPPKRNKALYKPNQTIKFKNKGKQRLAPPTEINDDDDDDHGGIECSLCPKTFRSEKSMFGHLRCHPEREWRGSQPPSTYTSSPVAAAVSLSNNNRIRSSSSSKLARSFKSWSITAKRGSNKGITISTASRKLIEEDKQLLEGAISFWLLMNGKTRPDDDDDIGSDPPPSTTSLEELIGDDDDDECPTLNQLSSSEENKEQSSSDEDEDESSSKIISDSRNERLLITLKKNCNKEIQTKLVDFDSPPLSSPPLHHIHNHLENQELEPVAVAPLNKTRVIINGNRLSATPSYRHTNGESSDNQAVEDHGFDEEYLSYKYVCSVCGMRYPSYHGLGGHMSAHNKEKKSDKASASTSRKKSTSKLQLLNYQTAPQDIGGDVKPHWSNVVPPSININVARNDGAINGQGIGLPFLINNVARRRNEMLP